MTDTPQTRLTREFLEHHWRFHPVDATFMGAEGHDGKLPPVGDEARAEEREALTALAAKLKNTPPPKTAGDRLDRRMIEGEIAVRQHRMDKPRQPSNPASMSGEAAFSLVSLLLPQSLPLDEDAFRARLSALPGWLDDAADALKGTKASRALTVRAQNEARAMAGFLAGDIRSHEYRRDEWDDDCRTAAGAFAKFADAIEELDDADPACGEETLSLIMAKQHGLAVSPREAVEMAEDAFRRLGDEAKAMAEAIDSDSSVAAELEALSTLHPDTPEAVLESYLLLDVQAVALGAEFVTPAQEYDLDYRWMSPAFRELSKHLYFLFYRSPPALNPGDASVYWVTPPAEGGNLDAFLKANSTAMVKSVHAVHHGSIGHHTQNARARQAESLMGQVAGTDCALGIAFTGAGTLIEGWACYAQDLMLEAQGFYTSGEVLLQKTFERRNAASVLVDIKLHLGEWSMADAARFYTEEAGFAPERVAGEITRNAMLPGSRLMYWLGTETIKGLRKRFDGDALDFHDTLLSYGAVPVTAIAEEMQREGLLTT